VHPATLKCLQLLESKPRGRSRLFGRCQLLRIAEDEGENEGEDDADGKRHDGTLLRVSKVLAVRVQAPTSCRLAELHARIRAVTPLQLRGKERNGEEHVTGGEIYLNMLSGLALSVIVATCTVDRAPVEARTITCPSTLSIGRLMFNTNDVSWFKQNFPRHDFALLWHELHPNEHTPLGALTQNRAFFPRLMRAWDKLGYKGFYDNSNDFVKKILKPAFRSIRQEHWVNMSWMVGRAVRLLQPLTFVLAVNITRARIREYNKWQPLSVHANMFNPPVLNVFCAVEMVAIDAAVPVHIIHSEALLRVCEADGPVACVEHIAQQRRHDTRPLTLQDMCGAVDVAVVSRQKRHPRHVCSMLEANVETRPHDNRTRAVMRAA
jgi:hypothetical protein